MNELDNAAKPVTIVIQTRITADMDAAFAAWLRRISAVVASQPGFVTETVMPPSPPAQLDWVILQRFASVDAATAWLRAEHKAGPGVTPGTFPLEGDLAESWSQPNETTYIFKLRKGVKWQNKPPVNGRELTADDVKYTFDRFVNEKGNANRAMMAALDKVEVVDKYTVKFTLKEPYVWFLDMVSNPMALAIIGFFVLEKFIHLHHRLEAPAHGHIRPVALMNLVGDGIHNFVDGAIIAGAYLASVSLGLATTAAVVLHEIPQEMGDLGVLVHAGLTPKRALVYNLATALTAVAGAVLTLLLDYMLTAAFL